MSAGRGLRSIFVRVLAVVLGAAAAAVALSTAVAATLVYDDKQAVIVEDVIAHAGSTRQQLAERIAIARAELRSVALAGTSGMIAEVPSLVSGNVIALRCMVDGDELVSAAADRDAHDVLVALPADGPAVTLLGPDRLLVRTDAAGARVLGVLDVASVLVAPPGWRTALEDELAEPPAGGAAGGAVVARVVTAEDGEDVLRAVAHRVGEPTVVVTAPLAPARRAAAELTRSVFFLSALVFVPLIGLAWLLARAVTRPVRSLAAAVRNAGVGPVVLPALPADEIGDLASAIGTMSRERHADAQGLRAAVRFARRAGRMLAAGEILAALEEVLREAVPGARWRVVHRSELGATEGLPIPATQLEARLPPVAEPAEDPIAHRTDDSRELSVHVLVEPSVEGLLLMEVHGGPTTHAVVIGVGVRATGEERLVQLLCGVASSALRQAELTLAATNNEKLAALGRLAAGVTHEINNALALIVTNIEILVEEAPPDLREVAEDARTGASRVARITEDLSSLSKGGAHIEARPEDLGRIVSASVRHALARRPGVEIEVEPFPQTTVRCDAGRIEQVLVNLLGNAADAALAAGRPLVCVAIRRELALASIEIRDRGAGIPASVRAHMFEPFYTTKGSKGTGLGLFISRTFARAHGGDIRVVATGAEGTTIALTVPVARLSGSMIVAEAPSAPGA